MLNKLLPILALVALGTASQAALAEGFSDVPRPIDYFVDGKEILGENLLAVQTQRDNIRAQGNFPLGKALFMIDRQDLLGLNRSLDSFDTSTLEVPLGGNFDVREERVAEFRTARAQRASHGLDRLGYAAGF